MQVVVVGRGASIALDDPSLGRSRRLDPAVAAALRSGSCDGSVVWGVLAEWGICRCPRCHVPGLEIVYGMPSGPAGAGQTLGGCCLLPLSGDTQCARCAMTWDRHPSGRRPG